MTVIETTTNCDWPPRHLKNPVTGEEHAVATDLAEGLDRLTIYR